MPFVYVGRKHGMSLERSLSQALDQAITCAGMMVVSGGDGRKGAVNVSVDGEPYRTQIPLRINLSDKQLWLVRPDNMPDPE